MRTILTRISAAAVAFGLALAAAGCSAPKADEPTAETSTTFTFGDTSFNPENEEADINPHHAYSGWAAVRYGIAETLFRYDDSMSVVPWLAESSSNVDDITWLITIKDGISFSSGRPVDAAAVQECLESLIAEHQRAAGDLSITSMESYGQELTIHTSKPVPTLLNSLADPYAAIIDMKADVPEEGIVVGTGPYQATHLESGKELQAEANPNYWDGTPGFSSIKVLTITDGDTLTLALQSGEIDAAYGLPYSSYDALKDFRFASTDTSRTYYVTANYSSPVMSDRAVREAFAQGIDKEAFVKVLGGNGVRARGPFPANFTFGGGSVHDAEYSPVAAKKTLEEAGWVDTNGDGVREKNGAELAITWLTYPSRQELPLLAESAQETLKDIGFKVTINSTAEHVQVRENLDEWDVYASAMVTAPTGDPEYFFTTHALDSSVANYGHYSSAHVEELAKELSGTFDADTRAELGVELQQQVLDDNAFVFVNHLKMSMVARPDIEGLKAHPCDFYEITARVHRAGTSK